MAGRNSKYWSRVLFRGFTGFGAVFSLAFAGLLVISAYSGHLNPQNHHPAFIFLNLALPYLLMLNLAIALCWLIIRQWRIALITVAAIALSWESVWTVFPLNFFSKKAANSENTFSVMTYNVNYFAYNNSRSLHEHNDILDYIYSKNPDIVLMQESIDVKFENMPSLSKADIDTLRSRYPYYTKVSNSDPSILSKHPFKIQKSLHIMKSKQYPVVSIYTVNIKGKEITFVNCHLQSNGLSSGDKSLLRNFMSQDSINNMSLAHKVKNSVLAKVVEASSLRAEQALEVRKNIDEISGPVIVCGDFNDTPSSWTYRTIRGSDLADCYCDCGLGHTITYHENRLYFRLDHIFYKGEGLKAIRIERGNDKFSDHYPLMATFECVEN